MSVLARAEADGVDEVELSWEQAHIHRCGVLP
jgi:hypothetical protein